MLKALVAMVHDMKIARSALDGVKPFYPAIRDAYRLSAGVANPFFERLQSRHCALLGAH
jgi:hypothetical protein